MNAPRHPSPTLLCPISRHAFSLIELLTVIAVIAILSGLIFSALTTVKSNADAIQCQSNMRQIFTATMLYAQAHDDKLPGPLSGAQPVIYFPTSSELPAYLSEYFSEEPANGGRVYNPIFACPAHPNFPNRSYEVPLGYWDWPFGYAHSADENLGPKNYLNYMNSLPDLEVQKGAQAWMLRCSDQKISGNRNLPERPMHSNGRHYLNWDGSIRIVK